MITTVLVLGRQRSPGADSGRANGAAGPGRSVRAGQMNWSGADAGATMYVDAHEYDYNDPHSGTQIVEYERTGPVYMHERPMRGAAKMLSEWEPDDQYLDLIASRQAAWRGPPRFGAQRSPHASTRLTTGHHMPAANSVWHGRRPRQSARPTSSPANRFSPGRDYSFPFRDPMGASARIEFCADQVRLLSSETSWALQSGTDRACSPLNMFQPLASLLCTCAYLLVRFDFGACKHQDVALTGGLEDAHEWIEFSKRRVVELERNLRACQSKLKDAQEQLSVKHVELQVGGSRCTRTLPGRALFDFPATALKQV